MVCDADNIADGIYPGSMNYQDTVFTANTTRAATSHYDAESFNVTTKINDILVAASTSTLDWLTSSHRLISQPGRSRVK